MKVADLVKGEVYAHSTKKDRLKGVDKVTIIDPTPCYGIWCGDETRVAKEGDRHLMESEERAMDCSPYNRVLVRDAYGHLRGVLPRYVSFTWVEFGRRLGERDKLEKEEMRRKMKRGRVRNRRQENIVAALKAKGIDTTNSIYHGDSMVLNFDSLEKLLDIVTDDEGKLMEKGA